MKLPVLFIHGIGIGLYPYINFLAKLNNPNRKCSGDQYGESSPDSASDLDGDIGIIALELMPISFRITEAMLDKQSIIAEIDKILQHHGWDKVVLVSHSYGSVISTYLLQSECTASKIGPVVLVDPVSILLHLPEVAYNFTTRQPQGANEHQLYYFASMDMGVSHTLHRHFFWNECILWKEDVRGRDVTVSCAGKDLIVDTEAVARYWAQEEGDALGRRDVSFKNRRCNGKALDLLWFEELDHAQVFDREGDYGRLIEVVRRYSANNNGARH